MEIEIALFGQSIMPSPENWEENTEVRIHVDSKASIAKWCF